MAIFALSWWLRIEKNSKLRVNQETDLSNFA